MKKSSIINIVLILLLLVGLSLLLYPSISDYWNSLHQSQAIANYAEDVAQLDEEEYSQLWQEAEAYNQALRERKNSYFFTEEEKEEYNRLLDPAGYGVMGYVEIPSISCSLPLYHGTDESVLQIALGHLEWSSLPTGGVGTHCVLSGHRGLPSAKLFTDLDKLVEGDIFLLQVLDRVLTYEVDQILIVEPQETASLQIFEGKDYCTLVTCTPYGKNTHRLLVRGHRVETAETEVSVRVTSEAILIEPVIVAPILAMPMLVLLLIILCWPRKRKKSGGAAHADHM
ncbi:MAG: class C sortase [Firmicutes bacterium]|nr:class C sortase [Bacillota bacterium]